VDCVGETLAVDSPQDPLPQRFGLDQFNAGCATWPFSGSCRPLGVTNGGARVPQLVVQRARLLAGHIPRPPSACSGRVRPCPPFKGGFKRTTHRGNTELGGT
jgi:hypothetical protein